MAKTNKKATNKAKPSAKNVKKATKPVAKIAKKAKTVAKPAPKATKPAHKVGGKANAKSAKPISKVSKPVAKKVVAKAKPATKSKPVVKVAKKPIKPVKAVKAAKVVKPAKVVKVAKAVKPIKPAKAVKPVAVKKEKPVKIKVEKPIKIKAEKPVKEKKIKIPKEKKVKPPKEEKPKRAKKPIIVKRIIEPTGAILNRFIEYKEELKKENEEFSKPSHSPVSKYLRFELEHPFNASPRLLFECFTTPSGFAEWFADDVNIKNDIYTFYWDGTEQHAEMITSKENKMARYRWLDEPKDTYFEFRIQIDDLTGDVALIITDFAENEREREASTLLWNTQIEALHHAIGAY